jgi:hypothetical protein
MNEIIKYETHYVVYFKKELELEPIIIPKESFEFINEKLITDSFVTINGHTHNKYNISHISPYDIDSDISILIRSIDNPEVKKIVQDEVKQNILSKKELTRERML